MRHKYAYLIGLTIVFLLTLGIPIALCVDILSDPIEFEPKCGPLFYDAESGFTDFTQLEWPQNTVVITVYSRRAPILCEGVSVIHFQTERDVLEKWVSKSPWETSE